MDPPPGYQQPTPGPNQPPTPPGVPQAPRREKVPNKHEGPVMGLSGSLAGFNLFHFSWLCDVLFHPDEKYNIWVLDKDYAVRSGHAGIEILALFACCILLIHPYLGKPGRKNVALMVGMPLVVLLQVIVLGFDGYESYFVAYFLDGLTRLGLTSPYAVFLYFDVVFAALHMVFIIVVGLFLIKFCLDCMKHNNGTDGCTRSTIAY